MFKVDLNPDCTKLNKNEVHPIYKLQFLLHRRIVVEEPHKRNGPVQCTNCQEYGHTKSYCTLHPVCVACGGLHHTTLCSIKNKKDATLRKCANCGGNHTANYRGCSVYKDLKARISHQRQTARNKSRNISEQPIFPSQLSNDIPVIPGISYADVIKTGGQKPISQLNHSPEINGFQAQIAYLTQTLHQFMMSTQTRIEELIKTQNQLLQIVLAPK